NSRYGPHHIGIEYEADMAEVRETIAAHGIRIVRDIGAALHTHPADCFGVAFEFFEGTFFDNSPYLTTPLRPPAFWREHPLQLIGLKAYTIAVYDLAAASRFLQSFLSAEPIYEEARPEFGAHALGLRVADCGIELLAPDGEGLLANEMQHSGQGI